MTTKTKITLILAISILAMAALSAALPQAAADPKVNITFAATGYTNCGGLVITVAGNNYYTYSSPLTLSLKPTDKYTVTAVPSITSYDSIVYTFSSWTNGNGLTTNSGTFTVPNAATTVAANYERTTYTAKFATTGLSNLGGNVLEIDGTSYIYSALGSTNFLWAKGSTHTVKAFQPIYNSDTPAKGYSWASWTNGNGLTAATGTFTMPASDVTVTANYAQSTVQVLFSTSGLSNLNQDTVLTIDGTTYTISSIPNINFQWLKGSTHTITAASSITGWDNVKHDFNSWTNGNGLTTASGTFTTPNSNVAVTANYAVSTTTSHTAHFAINSPTSLNGNVLEIDGVNYLYSNLGSTNFLWAAGSTHTVKALQPIYNYDTPAKGYNFSSWTNGNGLTTDQGTFTMPNSDVTATANYVQSTVQVLFRHSGLSNLNSDTIVTIDGITYDYWSVLNTNFQWAIGSTHTITAANTLTGYDHVTHNFQSWTNGNGLTTATGTFITPSTDVAVTENYGLAPTSSATTLSVSCSVDSVDKGNSITVSGTLTSTGTGVTGKTITLTYYNGTAWCPIGSPTTAAGGAYTYSWTVPAELENGVYPVKATFAGDSTYLASSASTGTTGNGPSLQVLPESWGSIVALLACFGGALVFFKLRNKRSSTT